MRSVDLNHRPSGYEPDELPGCSTPRWCLYSIDNLTEVKGKMGTDVRFWRKFLARCFLLLYYEKVSSKGAFMKFLSRLKSNEKENPGTKVALILAVGIAVGGWFIGNGVYDALARRTVTVKGLAERDVVADMAIWNINISRVGGDLAIVQTGIDSDIAKIKEFLNKAGFADDEIQNNRVQVRDNFAGYSPVEIKENQATNRNNSRYVIETGIIVRSRDVDLIDSVSRKLGELVRQGITIREDYSGPIYTFNGLNDIKISMIEQSTKNATAAGRQFAADAGARLGRIHTANQGVFQIESRDPTDRWNNDERQSIHKRVRVVSTVTFYLK